ncbi:META domain-containing protein [Deinococcus irradiatisoli]|nr:META domain-containing protein [Deinococcus irradiatisoli]
MTSLLLRGRAGLLLLALTLAASSLAAAPVTLSGTFTPPTTAAPDNSVPIGGYTLVSFTDNGQTGAPSPQLQRPTLSFDGQRASGFAGCNTFGGSYVARQQVLRFGGLVTTRMACPAAQSTAERQYLRLLRGVNRFEISGPPGNQTLTLFSGKADQLTFMQNVGSGEVAFSGIRSPYDGTWTLVRPPSGLQLSADARPTQFTLRGTDISGFDGCNTFSARANLSSGRLSFAGPVNVTKVPCPPQTASLTPLLTVGAEARVQGNTLTLISADGGQWVFSR